MRAGSNRMVTRVRRSVPQLGLHREERGVDRFAGRGAPDPDASRDLAFAHRRRELDVELELVARDRRRGRVDVHDAVSSPRPPGGPPRTSAPGSRRGRSDSASRGAATRARRPATGRPARCTPCRGGTGSVGRSTVRRRRPCSARRPVAANLPTRARHPVRRARATTSVGATITRRATVAGSVATSAAATPGGRPDTRRWPAPSRDDSSTCNGLATATRSSATAGGAAPDSSCCSAST